MEANDKKVVNKEVGKEIKTKEWIHILSITLSIIAIILSVIAISTSICSNKGCRMKDMPCAMYGQCWQYGEQRGPQRQFRGNNQQNRQWKYNQNGKKPGNNMMPGSNSKNNMPQWSNPWNNYSQNNFNRSQFGNFSKNNNDNTKRFNRNGNNNKIPAENENNAPKIDDQNVFPSNNAGIPMMPQ